MKCRRSSSVSRNYPTSNDLTNQTRQLFQNAGTNIKPIYIHSPLEAAKEIKYLESHISSNVDWDQQVSAMQRGMALVNGGALEIESFKKGLVKISPGLVAAANNLRSTLVKQSCLFIAQLVREMGASFDTLGEFIISISNQLSHGTQIIAESCKFAILCISKYCQSKKIFKSICDLCGTRGSASKSVGAEALEILMLNWDTQFLNLILTKYESILSKLITDASINPRIYARQAAKAYGITFPQRSESFFSKLDQRTLRAINDCKIKDCERVRTIIPPKNEKIKKNIVKKNEVKNPENDILANPPRIFKLKQHEIESKEQKTVENDRRLPLSNRRKGIQNINQKQKINKKEQKGDGVKQQDRSKIPSIRNPHKNHIGEDDDNENYLSKIVVPRRQSSVQPQRKNKDEVSFMTSELRPKRVIRNTEKKKTIQLIPGEEKKYLELLRRYITDDKKTELASSMIYISHDLLSCVSNSSSIISSNALLILKDFLPIFSSHFKSLLTTLVETLITQIDFGNSRSSETAQIILSNLHNIFENNDLLLICLIIHPSVTLLKFVESLTTFGNLDIEKEATCHELLKLSFNCREIKSTDEIKNIVRYVYESNQKAFYDIINSLKERNNNEFIDFISSFVPILKPQNKSIEIPSFDIDNPTSWFQNIKIIYNNIKNDDDEWRTVRSKIYAELNKSLCEQIEVDKIIPFIYNTIFSKGIDEYEIFLPGLLISTRNNSSKTIDAIINLIFKKSGLNNLILALQPLISDCNNNCDITRIAIVLQNKLINSISQDSLIKILPTIIPSLTQAFESKYPEIRKAVVLSFVELYAKLGDDVMNNYTSHLNRGQLKLISIYISRRKA